MPEGVRENIRNVFGAEDWLAALPETVLSLRERWDLEAAGPAMAGGTHSYAAPVLRRSDGARPRCPESQDFRLAADASTHGASRRA